jgi:hypothetical protein
MFWRTRPTPSETIVEWERKGARQAQPQAAELGRESIGRDSTLRFSKNTRNAAPNWRARSPNVKAQNGPPNGDARQSRPALCRARRWALASLDKAHKGGGVTVVARQRRIREAGAAQTAAKRTQTSGIRRFRTPGRTGSANFNVGSGGTLAAASAG